MKTFKEFLEQKINEMDMQEPPAIVAPAKIGNEKDEIQKQKQDYFNKQMQNYRPDAKKAIEFWILDRDVKLNDFINLAKRLHHLTYDINKIKLQTDIEDGVAITWFDKEKGKFVDSFAKSDFNEFIKLLEKIIPSSPESPMQSNPMPSNIGDYLPKRSN